VNGHFKDNIPQSGNVIENLEYSTCSWSSFPYLKKKDKLPSSKECDDLDFNTHVLRETSDLDSRTSRERLISREVFCVLCVHLSKVVHVAEEDRGLDDVFHRCSSSLEDLGNVGEDKTSLFSDCAGAELSSCRIEGNLARSKQHAVGLDRLAVRADGLGCLVCCNNLLLLFPTAATLAAATSAFTSALLALLASTLAALTAAAAAFTAAFTGALLALLASTLAALAAVALGSVAGALAVLAMALPVRTEAGAFALLTAAFLCTLAMAALLTGCRVLSTAAFATTARHVCQVD